MRTRKSGAFYTDNAENLPLNTLSTRKVYKKPFVFSSALYSVWSVCSVVLDQLVMNQRSLQIHL